MSAVDPNRDDLRTEYGVIGSYTTALTGARFQTVAIYLAAVGLIASNGAPSRLTATLMLVVSVGLWLLELRNRDMLERLGERGTRIEKKEWRYRPVSKRESEGGSERGPKPGSIPTKGGAGFFLDGPVRPRLRLLTTDPIEIPEPLAWFLTHAFAIDLVFLGVIGYAIALLADVGGWPSVLIALAPAGSGLLLAPLLRRSSRRHEADSVDPAA
jgi:hypothetical protein